MLASVIHEWVVFLCRYDAVIFRIGYTEIGAIHRERPLVTNSGTNAIVKVISNVKAVVLAHPLQRVDR